MEQNLEILDTSQALSRVGGDLAFLLELVGITQAACPTLLRNTREAVQSGDLKAVQKSARLFKAAAENVSAGKTYDAALELEAMAQCGLQSAVEACLKLEKEVARLTPTLAAFEDALWFSQC